MESEWIKTPSGLKYIDYRRSDGAPVKSGDLLIIHYKLALSLENIESGPWVEITWETKQPIKFRLGYGEVIKGLDEGIEGMRISGERRIIVPPKLAFGDRGVPPKIPANATLVYQIYIVDVEK
jgi:peptidylprolyl isomerase